MRELKYIFCDVDGVLTDGTKWRGFDGYIQLKRFCDKDYRAIRSFISHGVKVVLVSSELEINSGLARQWEVPFLFKGDLGKGWKGRKYSLLLDYFSKIEGQKLELNDPLAIDSFSRSLAIGDSIDDLDMLLLAALPCLPTNADEELTHELIRYNRQPIHLQAFGGEGVLHALWTLFRTNTFHIGDFILPKPYNYPDPFPGIPPATVKTIISDIVTRV